jgi:hypothetical protein
MGQQEKRLIFKHLRTHTLHMADFLRLKRTFAPILRIS